MRAREGKIADRHVAERDSWALPFALVVLSVLLFKLWLSAHVYGTNDVTTWWRFARRVHERGVFQIYALESRFNHPPAITLWLLLDWHLDRLMPGIFPFLIRLPAIVADAGSALLAWRLGRRLLPEREQILPLFVFAANPVLVMVSGFHGNTDPVFGFLTLASLYVLCVRRDAFVAGLLFGLAFNVKIASLLAAPAVFLWLGSRESRGRFAVGAAITIAAGYATHLLVEPTRLFRRVFAYGSYPGVWGVSHLLDNPSWYPTLGKVLVVVSAVLASLAEQRTGQDLATPEQKQRSLITACATSYLVFLVFTPGFGVQYFCWALPFTVFWGRLHLAYSALATAAMAATYSYWSGGFPWDYANAWEPAGAPTLHRLSLALWEVAWWGLVALLAFRLYGLVMRSATRAAERVAKSTRTSR